MIKKFSKNNNLKDHPFDVKFLFFFNTIIINHKIF